MAQASTRTTDQEAEADIRPEDLPDPDMNGSDMPLPIPREYFERPPRSC